MNITISNKIPAATSTTPGILPIATAADFAGTPSAAKAVTPADVVIHRTQGLVRQVTAGRMSRFRAALAGRMTGDANPVRVLCIGDSTTAGYGTNGLTYAGARATAYPRRLAAILTSEGLSAHEAAVCGASVDETATGGTPDAYDPRLTLGAGWASTTASQGVIGRRYLRNNSTANSLSFAPGISFNRIEIVHTNSASFTVDIGGAVLATQAATTPLTRTTVNCTEGVNTVNIKRVGGDVYILSIHCYSSTSTALSVIAGANPGGTSNDLANAADYFALDAIKKIQPHLTILSLGVNDAVAGISVSAYKANMEAIVDAAELTGDVILWSPIPWGHASFSTYSAGYLTALREIAEAKGVLLVDLMTRFNTYASTNSLGYMIDLYHPNSRGAWETASEIAVAIRSVV